MKISIITINYNDKEGLARTIGSVTGQAFPGIEYIVIDGGSADGSVDIIRKYADKISYWVSEKDKGIYNAMNKGIQKATGDYLLFLNSGDEFQDSNALGALLREPPAHDFVYGDLTFVEKTGTRTIVYPDRLKFSYFIHQSLPHPACLIRKSCFERLGMYDEALRIVSDWKFFIIAICRHGFSYQHRTVTVSKFYDDGISSDPANREKVWLEKDKVLREDFDLFREDTEELLALRAKVHKLQYLNPLKLLKRLTGNK